jgi:MFS_1 like family
MRRMPPTLPEFVAVYGLLYAAFGVQSPFLPALLREQGLHSGEIGIVLGASTARRRVRFFLAAGAGVIRWTVVAFTTSPVLLSLVQPLHGLTFALLHLASMRLIVQVVPIRLAATAQSIYGTWCVGLATALLTLASGLLYERMGGHAFLVMAALCLLALPMCAGLRVSRVQD